MLPENTNDEDIETHGLVDYDEWAFWTFKEKLTNDSEKDLVVLTPEECRFSAGFMVRPVAFLSGSLIVTKTYFFIDIDPWEFKDAYIYKVMRANRIMTPGDVVSGYLVRFGLLEKST